MWWDNESDSEQEQRWKNMTFLKMPFTNKTRDEVFEDPTFGIVAACIILVLVGIAIYASLR